MSHTLYSTLDHSSFYYIPDDATLPEGALVLQSLTGKRLEVDPKAALAYEVPEDRAKELTKEIIASFSRGLGRFLSGAVDVMRAAQRAPDAPAKPPATRISDALGLTEEQLAGDKDAVVAAIREAGRGLERTLRQSWSANPVSEEVARQRLDTLARLAKEEVAPVLAEIVRGVPDALRDAMENQGLQEDIEELTDKLQALGDQLRGLREDREE